jgi:hypothetical protein
MSKRYKIKIKNDHKKVNQFAYTPDQENDISVPPIDKNNIQSPIQTKEPKPQLNELDQETTYAFLDSEYVNIDSYSNGRPLSMSTLRQYFPRQYPLISGIFNKRQSKGINFNGQLYAWPGELAFNNDLTDWAKNIYKWTNDWLNTKKSVNKFEEAPFLYEIQDINIFNKIADDLAQKIFDENITTNLDGFDEYIRTFLPKAQFSSTGRTGKQRYTQPYPYIVVGDQRYRVKSYREWPRNNNFTYLKNKLHSFLEKAKGAYPVLLKNISNIENNFPDCKITLEYKLKNLGYAEWLQQNFSSYDNGRINTVELFNFLISNNSTKNEFKLSSTHSDRFIVERNLITVNSPYGDKEIQYNYWDDYIVPELGRIDLYVETPKGPIAYECDGFFHYGVGNINKDKNFAKQFLHDQMQNYFLEKVKGIRLIRRPLLGDWKKNIISFVKDDLGPLIKSPIEKEAYNNYSFFK